MIAEKTATPAQEAASAQPQVSRFLARQPILDLRRQTIGYELLFRTGWENRFSGESDDATRAMLDNCLYMGIESLTGGGLAFVNCTRDALAGRLVTLLPPEMTVLELLETVEPDAEVIAACAALCDMGYRLALDDFIPRPEMQPLVQMASYIKVDFQQSDAAARRSIRRMARHSRAAFLAEKVEDEAGMKHAIAEGFEYFQGYFFCRPKIVANREIPPNRMHYLRLLIELTKTPLNLCDVTRIVEMEPSLCYRLLRLANSALHGSRQNIASVSDAFLLVGEDRFRTLVSVAASCLWGEGQSPALIRLALERARFCELAAPLARENPTEQFMLGLMSLVDAMLEMPMETITKSLPLRAEAREALLGASSATAQPLRWIRGFESGGWKHDGGALQETLTGLYLQAVRWVSESLAESL